jgi:hypothetical protein
MCVGARTRILHRPILYTDTYTKQSAHRATERKNTQCGENAGTAWFLMLLW